VAIKIVAINSMKKEPSLNIHVLFCLFIFLFMFSSNLLASINESLINSDWVYFSLWKLEANGLIDDMFISTRPYEREEIAKTISNLTKKIKEGKISPNPYELKLIKKLESEFFIKPKLLNIRILAEAERKADTKSSLSFWGAVNIQPTDYLTLYEEVDIERGREVKGTEGITASQRLNIWKWDYTADFQKAYLRLHNEKFSALLGRQTLFWGPGYDGSLVISDNSPPFDMIMLQGRIWNVKFTSFSAMLDKMWNEHDNPPYRYLANRFISGHRLDWLVNKKLELGLSEILLYAGEAQYMDLQYLNPILPYYANQYNSSLDDNSLVSIDAIYKPVKKIKIYMQFLVDDFSYADNDPNALGYIFGINLSDPFSIKQMDFRAEYARIGSWTYTHLEPENQYTHYGWVIGHHLGPDADQILFEICRMLDIDSRLKVIYAFKRDGSQTVADRYRGEDYKKMKFPSGDVKNEHKLGFGFMRESLNGLQINLSFQHIFAGKSSENELAFKLGFLLIN
jgi:hypothetical protein